MMGAIWRKKWDHAVLKDGHDVLFVEANPIPVKWAVQQMELIDNGHIRLPLTELNPEFHGLVLQAMKTAGVEA